MHRIAPHQHCSFYPKEGGLVEVIHQFIRLSHSKKVAMPYKQGVLKKYKDFVNTRKPPENAL
ncbi:hypothetical protein GCM10007968_03520 [Sporolactobacillus putidus]|uniref:Uncharacterized protein n=1 Tax=Sporolactobacillus putidus TaxID=492735 RepID=A0A917RXU5_9BACL|nr:hypothetical protein GCM10007968_03520 [Sporolactobacillus putidus]